MLCVVTFVAGNQNEALQPGVDILAMTSFASAFYQTAAGAFKIGSKFSDFPGHEAFN